MFLTASLTALSCFFSVLVFKIKAILFLDKLEVNEFNFVAIEVNIFLPAETATIKAAHFNINCPKSLFATRNIVVPKSTNIFIKSESITVLAKFSHALESPCKCPLILSRTLSFSWAALPVLFIAVSVASTATLQLFKIAAAF